jgi:aryl-phospho-beta-D-glucosidase BglC (GH1 family)
MRTAIAILLGVLTTVSVSVTPAAAPERAAFVTTRGALFIGPDGKPLLLRGIGLGNWLLPEGYMFKFKQANSPRLIHTLVNQLVGEDEARRFWATYRSTYITAEDIAFIKRAGFNSIRVPFSYRLFVDERDPSRLEGPGYELLDRVVGWCRDVKVFVVLDMHAAPGGQTGDNIDDSWGFPFLFDSAASQDLTIRIWRKIAARYSNEPAVIGYDLLNEPIAPYFDTASLNPKLEPLYRRIVTAIREVDRNHIIFLGGAQWNTNFRVFGPPFDDKLAYTFHKYWMDVKPEAIQEYVAFSRTYNVPIWLGESGENTDEWVGSFKTLLEQNGIGWCFWPYKKMDSTSSVVSVNVPAGWDAIVAYAERPRVSYEEVRKTRPPQGTIATALAGYLQNIQFRNCRVNRGYLTALGVRSTE